MTDISEVDARGIRMLFRLPDEGDLVEQLSEWLEYQTVDEVRLHNCISNLLAEPVYEGGQKDNGIAVKFMMRLHLLAYEAGHPRYTKDNPLVAEALAALGDPAENSPESLAACRARRAGAESAQERVSDV